MHWILWSDEHRQNVSRQGILGTTHGIQCERQKGVVKTIGGLNFHPCRPREGPDSS